MTECDPDSRRFGYARVSTYGQTLDGAGLRSVGVDADAPIQNLESNATMPYPSFAFSEIRVYTRSTV